MKKASRFSNKMCFEEVLKAAQSGNANAQFHAGIEYIKGNRTARNFEEAEKWFDKAAAQGHAEAQFSVWYLFNTVSQYCSNPFMRIYNAVNYLVKSAVQGHLDAQLALAHLHLQLCHCEWKIKESYEEASKQYANAEKQDNIPVKFDIKAEDGNLKAVSIKNLDEGLKWYKIAAENGHAVAQNELGNIYLGEYHFLKSDENHKEGLKWLAKFAEQGSPIAQKKLADIYFYGINTEKNYPEAEKWMTKRAENDGKFNYLETFKKHSQIVRCLFQPSSDASEELSIIPSMFDIRHYKNKNFLGIVELITKEAEKGDDFAQYKLGEIYYYGHGIGNDYSQSLNWFTKASSQGNKDADKYLKQMYFYGIGVGQDYEKAYHFLQKGKQKFYDLLSLSFLFYNGLGVQKDLVKAEQLLCKFALKYNHAFSSFVDGYYTHLNYAEYRKCKSIYHDFEDMLPEFVKNKQLMGDFLHYTVMVAINDDCNLNCKRPNADFPAENKIEHKKAKDVNIDYLYSPDEKPLAYEKLGFIYCYGNGVRKDFNKAFECFLEAAKGSSLDSLFYLTVMYHESCAIENNLKIEFKKFLKTVRVFEENNWSKVLEEIKNNKFTYDDLLKLLKISAEEGNVFAQFRLGNIYYEGEKVKKNYNEAFQWIKKSAEQDNWEAQLILGEMYYNGLGVEKNCKEAEKWNEKAISGYDIEYKNGEYLQVNAIKKIADMFYTGNGIRQNYLEALKWYRRLVRWTYEFPEAYYFIGELVCLDNAISEKIGGLREESAKWYRMAAELGHIEAQFVLGYLHYSMIPNDVHIVHACEAEMWLKKAADKGNLPSQIILADLYYGYGPGEMNKDYCKAAELYLKAAEQGNLYAQTMLGNMYYNGQGVKQDYSMALKWYEKAAEYNKKDAVLGIAKMYYNGKGVSQDKQKAYEYSMKISNSEQSTESIIEQLSEKKE